MSGRVERDVFCWQIFQFVTFVFAQIVTLNFYCQFTCNTLPTDVGANLISVDN